ncbi:MAG TPA: thioredoxin [Lautropia sp.]|jgi:putative thioredoxin|nr:thioredoxin [Lautropia sp.]
MIEVTRQNFQVAVIAASEHVPVLVEFWAPWCAPCRALTPVLERIEHDLAGMVTLVKVNSDDNPEIAAALGVRGIPNVVLFKDGKPVDRFVGVLPEAQIRAFLAPHVETPEARQLAVAREAMLEKRFGIAAEALSVVLAVNPANREARADYVTALTRLGRLEQARAAFEPLAGAARGDLRLAASGRLLDAYEAAASVRDEAEVRAAVEQAPEDNAVRLTLAHWLMAQSRWAEAMDELIVIAARDRRFGEDIARRSILAIFELCRNPALVSTYRRKLSASLY